MPNTISKMEKRRVSNGRVSNKIHEKGYRLYMGHPTEIIQVFIPVKPKTWQEYVLRHQLTQADWGRSIGERRTNVQPKQLSIWEVGKAEKRINDQ